MPSRHHWHDVPDKIRRQVEQHVGAVHAAYSIPAGASCQLAAVLDTDTGRIFCKGGTSDSPTAWLYRNEARVNPYLPDVVPRLRWTINQDGWVLLGFDYAAGRHPDLAPGSPDLRLVAELLTALNQQLTPSPLIPVQRFADRWKDLVAPELVDGQTLLHTDLTPRNFLLSDCLRLVDWSSPALGAAWIDIAFVLVRLIRAGHTPAEAEAWARQVPAWAHASDSAVTGFANGLVYLWERRQHSDPASHRGPLLTAAKSWLNHRDLADRW